MTDLFVAVEGSGETGGTFSALDKAKAAVEAKIVKDLRDGDHGHQYKEGPLPELTWRDRGGGHHVCGFVHGGGYFNTPVQWYAIDPEIYTIELDPAELPW